jgi:hypothetical protein
MGWCVRHGNWDDLRTAVRLTHTLWGGRFNPIIPVGNPKLSASLVELFQVDALYPVVDDAQIRDFIHQFPWLPWPSFHDAMFLDSLDPNGATFLDVYHPIRHIFEQNFKGNPGSKSSAMLYEWDDEDPLGDVFLCSFGGYPKTGEARNRYVAMFKEGLKGRQVKLLVNEKVDTKILSAATPSEVSKYLLTWSVAPRRGNAGFYVGDARDFDDIVSFWNIRACDADVHFYDPRYDGRMKDFKDQFAQLLGQRRANMFDAKDAIAVWTKVPEIVNWAEFGTVPIEFRVSDDMWSGIGLKPAKFYIDESHSVLASIDEAGDLPILSVQLLDKPFFAEQEFHHQQVIATIKPIGDPAADAYTFWTPFLPKLNRFFGARTYHRSTNARVESEGLGIITAITSNHISLKAISKRDLVAEIFREFGIEAQISHAGRIATRLIQQMGGLQGCRVFKIPGVRHLIETKGPQSEFTRQFAEQAVGMNDPATGRPRFTD